MGPLVGYASAAIALLLFSIQTSAQVPGNSPDRVRAGHISLEIVGGLSGQEKRLAVVMAGKELGSIVLPPRVSEATLTEGLNGTLVHPNGQDLAVGLRGDSGPILSIRRKDPASFVVVFLRQNDGSYLAVDVSRAELANIGFAGPDRPYSDVMTVPVEWLVRREQDDMVQIRIQTRAKDQSGLFYRPTDTLLITRDGRPIWR